MANLLNYDAETGAGAIFDDTTAGLIFENTGGGPAVEIKGAALISNTSISAAYVANLKAKVNSGTKAANATVAGLTLVGTSYASGAVLALENASSFVSTTTIKAITAVAADCGAIRIVKPNGTFGYIPVYPDSAITGVVV